MRKDETKKRGYSLFFLIYLKIDVLIMVHDKGFVFAMQRNMLYEEIVIIQCVKSHRCVKAISST